MFLMGTILFLKRPSILQSVEQFLCKVVSIKHQMYKALHIQKFLKKCPLTNKVDLCKNMRAGFLQLVVQLQQARTINLINKPDHQQN